MEVIVVLEATRLRESLSSGRFELSDGGFNVFWSVLGVPSVVLDVELGIIFAVLFVSELVSNADVTSEAFKINWVSVLPFKGDTEAEAKAEGFEDGRVRARRILAKVVNLEVVGRSVESSFGEVGK
jgi:hypothetical protein